MLIESTPLQQAKQSTNVDIKLSMKTIMTILELTYVPIKMGELIAPFM
jgi:hypothetical protein